MTGSAVLWIVGLACFIVALFGKDVTIGNIKIPATAEKRARAGIGIVGVLALILGAILVFHPNDDQQSVQTVGVLGNSAPSTSPPNLAQEGSTPDATAGSPSPTYSGTPILGSADIATYLSDMNPGGTDTPDVGSYNLLGHAYRNSIGFSDTCGDEYTVNYDLNGKYQNFSATVGISDSDQNSADEQAEFSVFGNPGGGPERKLREVTAAWGAPSEINIKIRGVTLLTLDTADPNSCIMGEMVWGDARLIR